MTSIRCSRPRTPAAAPAAVRSAPRRTCAHRWPRTSAGARSCAGAPATDGLALARVLIVGCGCRGQSLAGALVAGGHAVRGTTRDAARLGDIEASGAQAVVADPDRLGTLVPPTLRGERGLLADGQRGAMGGGGSPRAAPPNAARAPRRHAGTRARLRGVRAGSTRRLLADGAQAVRAAGRTWRMPVSVTEADPGRPRRMARRRCGPPWRRPAVRRVLEMRAIPHAFPSFEEGARRWPTTRRTSWSTLNGWRTT